MESCKLAKISIEVKIEFEKDRYIGELYVTTKSEIQDYLFLVDALL